MSFGRPISSLLLAVAVSAVASPAGASAPVGHFAFTGAGAVVVDTKTGLIWQRFVSGTKYSWADASIYCSTAGSTLGGAGWRLPTAWELLSLVDYSQAVGPMIDDLAFPTAPADRFWSITVPAFKGNAGYVDFGTGRIKADLQSTPYLVRCVRSGP